jgi:hypothetical protein
VVIVVCGKGEKKEDGILKALGDFFEPHHHCADRESKQTYPTTNLKPQAELRHVLRSLHEATKKSYHKPKQRLGYDMDRIDQLRREIAQRESELADLRSQLAIAESEQRRHQRAAAEQKEAWCWPLEKHDYERYSRQMIVPNFGLQGKEPLP